LNDGMLVSAGDGVDGLHAPPGEQAGEEQRLAGARQPTPWPPSTGLSQLPHRHAEIGLPAPDNE
jgi:hypothetical protein